MKLTYEQCIKKMRILDKAIIIAKICLAIYVVGLIYYKYLYEHTT